MGLHNSSSSSSRPNAFGNPSASSSASAEVIKNVDDIGDDFYLAVVAELNELNLAREGFVGKMPDTSDAVQAFVFMKEELEEYLASIKLARSLENLEPIPAHLLSSFQQIEAQELADRNLARTLANGTQQTPTEPTLSGSSSKLLTQPKIAEIDDAQVALPPLKIKLPSIGTSKSFVPKLAQAQPEPPKAPAGECISCSENSFIKTLCGHFYCTPCLKSVCVNSVTDRSFFPAKCCKKEFTQEQVKASLTETQYARYVQYQTDLVSTNISQLDPAFRDMVEQNGWQLCPKCGAGIEKTQDCGHMTCIICRFEFCYRCGADWKPTRKCNCDLWRPEELDQIIQERAPHANIAEQARIRRVYQHHDQHRHNWEKHYIMGKYKRCPTCGWVCNQWYWRCEDCVSNSCGRCAFNQN
ncbi:hypothetical protein HDU77_008657 [Chytriomyces hyalinus]|nr:hypothetical protein HDU77_008657 [Chytriomyces hyalinus]